jgi:hypothetical protein
MTDKSNFTPDEWKLLLESVTMAGVAVSAADASGLLGLLKESFARGHSTDDGQNGFLRQSLSSRLWWPILKLHKAEASRVMV